MLRDARKCALLSMRTFLPCLLRRLAATVAGRLIGDPRVVRAIGQAGQRLAAAEEEFRTGGIADRPVAGGLVELGSGSSSTSNACASAVLPRETGRETRIICWAGRALRGRGAAEEGLLARPERPSRWTLPITAFRVTFPSSAAIWLAESPPSQSFFSCSTRSSVQVNTVIALFPSCRAGHSRSGVATFIRSKSQ
jgi:hypothetical protein